MSFQEHFLCFSTVAKPICVIPSFRFLAAFASRLLLRDPDVPPALQQQTAPSLEVQSDHNQKKKYNFKTNLNIWTNWTFS